MAQQTLSSIIYGKRQPKLFGFKAQKIPRLAKFPNFYKKSFRESGKDFEKRVQANLKKKGFDVFKAHHRHYDLFAKKGNKEYYIECKCLTARLSSAEHEFCMECVKKGKHYWIAHKTKTNRIEYKKY